MHNESQRSEGVPSARADLLRSLIGRRVVRMARDSWLSPDEAMGELGIPARLVFRRSPGSLLVTTESGDTLGFGGSPATASVTVWRPRGPGVPAARDMATDEPSYMIEASDPRYSDPSMHELLGRLVESVSILRRAPFNAKHAMLPREAAVVLGFQGGDELVLGHGLHNDSDDFAILSRNEIVSGVRPQLEPVTW